MPALDVLLEAGVREKVFPGASAWLGVEGRCVWSGVSGNAGFSPKKKVGHDTFFDLASLTKALGTTLALMALVEKKALTLEDRLWLWLPEWRDGGLREEICLFHLLQHTSGLPAHRHFYRDWGPVAEKDREVYRLGLLRALSLESIPGERTLYSDLGFMLLKTVVERAGGRAFAQAVRSALPQGAEMNLFFPEAGILSGGEGDFAATGVSPVRHRRLKGEVHDENAAAMGGVDGHAGLFGTAAAVGKVGMALVEAWHGDSSWRHPGVLRRFLQWPGDGKRPLGFDRPSGPQPSCGRFFSRKTAGHLGFTGSSLWMDMERKIVVVLLTNRVHYGDEHWKIRSFRPRFHDGVMEALGWGEKGEFCL